MLFAEGDRSDALYLLTSGRLQASVANPGDQPRIVGEIGRGESVGEMGVFSGKPRRAHRDGDPRQCAGQDRAGQFPTPSSRRCRPWRSISTGWSIERLQRSNASQKRERNVTNIAIVSASEGVSTGSFLRELAGELTRQQQTVVHLTSASVDLAAGRTGAAQVADDDPPALYWLINYLDELEDGSSVVLYEADAAPTAWTRRCLRQADEVLLLADARASPEPSRIELACLRGAQTRGAAGSGIAASRGRGVGGRDDRFPGAAAERAAALPGARRQLQGTWRAWRVS